MILKESSAWWLFVSVEAQHMLFAQDVSPGRTDGPHSGEWAYVNYQDFVRGSAAPWRGTRSQNLRVAVEGVLVCQNTFLS